MTERIWNYKNKNLKSETVTAAAEKYRIPRLLATVILNRGIDEEHMKSYLAKTMRDIRNPHLMLDMEKAAKRIAAALEKYEKIVIYGDYDVDGITSTALLYDFLSSQGADVDYYIPDRKGEGYGINIMAVNKLARQGTKLLITVDCGITSIGEVEFAKLQGVDVIITDHHTCKERLPMAAAAIVNPKRPDCDYPFDGLAGVGVAFKLMLAVVMELGLNTTEYFKKYVEIATIGTIADVVPLIDENRTIVSKGLQALQHPSLPGLRAITEVAGVADKPLDSSGVAFAIAPRMNAAGRLGTAKTAVELLLTRDENKAREIALQLDAENKERQAMEQQIFEDALEFIAQDPNFAKKRVIVLAKEGWHQGVIGIVASRINERFYKPCILISHNNGVGKGSGRSIPSFNLFDALSHCEKYLTEFGGHAVAAGLNLNMADFDAFVKEINKYADSVLTDNDMIPRVNIDCEITERDINMDSAKFLSLLEPFGMGNEKPVFALLGAEIMNIAPCGADNRHLRMRIRKNGVCVNCIGFGLGSRAAELGAGSVIDIACQLGINNYQGTESVQLLIKDIKKK